MSLKRDLHRHAAAMGFTLQWSNGGHIKCTAPNGRVVYLASTPSDYRGTRNAIAAMRRALRTKRTT